MRLKMKIKTSELKGRALDFATAVADGFETDYLKRNPDSIPKYTENWDDCGELIDKYGIELSNELVNEKWIYYTTFSHLMGEYTQGENTKIAICRAVVAFELGDEVDIPDELVGENGS